MFMSLTADRKRVYFSSRGSEARLSLRIPCQCAGREKGSPARLDEDFRTLGP